MADDSSFQFAGLLPFLKAAASTGTGASANMPTMNQIANGMANSSASSPSASGYANGLASALLSPMQQHALSARHPTQTAITPPFQPNGAVPGPINAQGVVQGPINPQGVAGPLPPEAIPVPGSVPASGAVMPPPGVGTLAGPSSLTMPQAPGLNAFSLTAGTPMAANHFSTGMPNPTGAR